MKKVIIIFVFLLCFQCKSKTESKEVSFSIIDAKSLVVSKEDWSVQTALSMDSAFEEIENHLMRNEKLPLKEAEKQIQWMIDKKLLAQPSLDYYVDNNNRQMKKLTYTEFKYYVKIVKDSVQTQH